VIAVVAVDAGPRACVVPLLSVKGFALSPSDVLPSDARALIVGTSDSDKGRAIEAMARRAAKAQRIPIVALEDYPGNYTQVAGGEADFLVVESEHAAKARTVPTWVCPSPRYDALRRQAAQLRAAYAGRDRVERCVLWAGQPETDDALVTLERLAPALAGMRLLFRAHPRDAGYASGAYRGIVEDVTNAPLRQCFERGPELVLTQFSQVTAEAGFHGIPSLHCLFPDAGGRTLREKKGYDVPPCCSAGASYLVREPAELARTLALAINDAKSREKTLAAFDGYYAAGRETLGELLAHLYNQGITAI
jgi:hypothetical protein